MMITADEIIKDALTPYGASLSSEGFIQRNGKILSVRIVEKRGRLRFESESTGLIFSGPVLEKTIVSFVEKFWMWTK